MSKKNILFLVGSLRRESFNRQLADHTKALIGDRANVQYLDYTDVPFFDQDSETPAPAAVLHVRKEVEGADALWIFTPEYNFQIPGVEKNLLDWLSRPYTPGDFSSGTAVLDKPVTLSGAGGKGATASVRKHLDGLLTFMKMKLMKEHETGVAVPAQSWGSNVLELSAEDEAHLKEQVEAFLKFIQ